MAPLKKSLLKSVKKLESEGLQKEKTLLSNLSALDCVLKDVYEARRPTSTDYDKRRDLIRVFNEIARELYGNSANCPVVEEFGSFLMDMFDARSDLDLSIRSSDKTVVATRSMQTETLRKFTKKLYKLRDQGHVTNVRPILQARVPVLKVTDCGSGVECDLSVGNLDGVTKSQIVLLVSSIDERFQKLSFLMKAWAKAQNINSAVDGTLNSLSLILLSAFHLQTRDTPILPPFSAILKDGTDLVTVKKSIHSFIKYGENNKESLAELFVSLLIKLVSVNNFWSEGLCASTFEGSWIQKKWNRKDGPLLGCISIEDFTDRSQNASRVLKSFETHIKIYSRIHSSLDQIRLFTEGRLNAVNLKRLLFGEHPTATLEVTNVNRAANRTQKKRKQPSEKIKKQRLPGGSRKGKNVTSTTGRKAKSQKTLSGSHLTQSFQGGQSEALNLTALTRLADQLVSISNPSIQGYGGIRPETRHVAPSFMSGQPLSVSTPSFQDSRRFVRHAENLGHAGPTFMAGQPLHGRGRYGPERAHVMDSSLQDYGGFRLPRIHTEGFSHGGTHIPVSHRPSFSDLPNQSYRGYRMEATRVENFRHDNSWDSRSYNNSMPTYHHPRGPSPHHVDHERWDSSYTPRPLFPLGPSPHQVDHDRWERSYTPRTSFPLGPSQYSTDAREFENRRRFK